MDRKEKLMSKRALGIVSLVIIAVALGIWATLGAQAREGVVVPSTESRAGSMSTANPSAPAVLPEAYGAPPSAPASLQPFVATPRSEWSRSGYRTLFGDGSERRRPGSMDSRSSSDMKTARPGPLCESWPGLYRGTPRVEDGGLRCRPSKPTRGAGARESPVPSPFRRRIAT